jgi:hypothetical protein
MTEHAQEEQAAEQQAPTAQPAATKPPKKTAEEKAAEKAAKAAQKAADKAKEVKPVVAKEVKPVVAKPEKDTKNGVTRPSTGVTKLVWDTADRLSSEKNDGTPVDRAPLVEALKGKVEVGTVHTQYGRWRKYYGLTEGKEARQARLKIARDAKDKEKADKKALKAAEKLAADEAAAKAEAAKQPESQPAAA